MSLKKMITNRIDVMIGSNQIIAQYFLYSYPEYDAKCEISPLVIAENRMCYFPVSQKTPVPVEEINRILEKIKAEGTLSHIFKKYGIMELEINNFHLES